MHCLYRVFDLNLNRKAFLTFQQSNKFEKKNQPSWAGLEQTCTGNTRQCVFWLTISKELYKFCSLLAETQQHIEKVWDRNRHFWQKHKACDKKQNACDRVSYKLLLLLYIFLSTNFRIWQANKKIIMLKCKVLTISV